MKITRTMLLILCLFTTLAPLAAAKTKVKVFLAPCGVVFHAAEKLASEKPYELTLDAKSEMKLIVSGSFWKGRSQITVSFYEASPTTCSVTVDSFYSGVLRNGTVFLDRLEKSDILQSKGNNWRNKPA
jgi:hypothetical protein